MYELGCNWCVGRSNRRLRRSDFDRILGRSGPTKYEFDEIIYGELLCAIAAQRLGDPGPGEALFVAVREVLARLFEQYPDPITKISAQLMSTTRLGRERLARSLADVRPCTEEMVAAIFRQAGVSLEVAA